MPRRAGRFCWSTERFYATTSRILRPTRGLCLTAIAVTLFKYAQDGRWRSLILREPEMRRTGWKLFASRGNTQTSTDLGCLNIAFLVAWFRGRRRPIPEAGPPADVVEGDDPFPKNSPHVSLEQASCGVNFVYPRGNEKCFRGREERRSIALGETHLPLDRSSRICGFSISTLHCRFQVARYTEWRKNNIE